MFNTDVVLMERSHLTDFVLPNKFSNDSGRRAQVSTIFSPQVTIADFTLLV